MFCLRVPTDPRWAHEAAHDLDAVLVDHAHCEMKAASNALSLVMRHPGELGLVRALTALAREELEHFHQVTAFLAQRGLALGAPPLDVYAGELRRAATRMPKEDTPSLTDRLLVGALIEARSCERFKLLLDVFPAETPSDLRAFYEELFACEARHYVTYVALAREVLVTFFPAEDCEVLEALLQRRLARLAEAEGQIVQELAARSSETRATVHG